MCFRDNVRHDSSDAEKEAWVNKIITPLLTVSWLFTHEAEPIGLNKDYQRGGAELVIVKVSNSCEWVIDI